MSKHHNQYRRWLAVGTLDMLSFGQSFKKGDGVYGSKNLFYGRYYCYDKGYASG